MRRQILRFPVGEQFRKMLQDDHEWFVITDRRLKILSAERGNIDNIRPETMSKAYNRLREMLRNDPPGKPIHIIGLHTHPLGDEHQYQTVPSRDDIPAFAYNKLIEKGRVVHIGFGVITPKAIVIVRLPTNKEELTAIQKETKDLYHRQLRSNIKDIAGRKGITSKNISDEKFERVYNDAQNKAFKSLAKGEMGTPPLGVKTVRKRLPFRMRGIRR